MKRIFSIAVLAFLCLSRTALTAEDATAEATSAATATPPIASSVGPDVIIKAIDITGNFEVPDDVILGVMTSKVGDPIDTKKLETDLEHVFDLGYFSEDVKASLSEFNGGAKITLRVVENPVVEKININGNKNISTADIEKVMKTKEKKILNSKSLREDVSAIDDLYKNKGFMAAHVLDVGMEPKDNALNIVIGEGVIQSIKVVFITKNETNPEEVKEAPTGKTKSYVILRELKAKPGDVFNSEKLQKDLQRVFNLGFFEDVRTRVEPGDNPGNIVLVIEVEEGKTGQLGFGAGYSSSSGLTGFLSFSERNLKGKGRRADTKLEFGGKRNDYELSYYEPWLDKKRTSVEFNIYRTSVENLAFGLGGISVPDYEENRKGFSTVVGRPLTDYTRWFVGLKAENVQIFPLDYLDGNSRSISLTLRTDTRDNIFSPSTGRFDSGTTEFNGGMLGGDFTYQKYDLDIRRFHPLKKKLVAAGHMFAGATRGGVPLFDRFDLGGVNSLRGYEENQFAGTKILYFNMELRQSFSGNLSGVVFADAGNAWERMDDVKLRPKDFFKSVGVGIRLKIPAFGMGPIRLDYAWALSISKSMIHFGFGQMF